jgi:hypothetical protein
MNIIAQTAMTMASSTQSKPMPKNKNTLSLKSLRKAAAKKAKVDYAIKYNFQAILFCCIE